MARYTVVIQTPRPGSDVFRYLADLRNLPEWDPGVARVTQIVGLGGGPGTSFDVVVSTARRGERTLRYVTTQHVEPRLLRIEARSPLLTSIDQITVSPRVDSGCSVAYDAELTLTGPLRWADLLIRPMFRRIGDRAAAGLVAALEGRVAAS
jgi:Polyketide cyclase / dehydrase and lipid transport